MRTYLAGFFSWNNQLLNFPTLIDLLDHLLNLVSDSLHVLDLASAQVDENRLLLALPHPHLLQRGRQNRPVGLSNLRQLRVLCNDVIPVEGVNWREHSGTDESHQTVQPQKSYLINLLL